MGEVANKIDLSKGEAGTPRAGSIPRDLDLVIGLVGAVGSDLPWVSDVVQRHLSKLGYEVLELSLSALLANEYGGGLSGRSSVTYDRYVRERMDAGNALRERWAAPEAVALLAVEQIRKSRDGATNDKPIAWILRSLKRPEEVRVLRHVYRGQFVLVGCHTPRATRIEQLADQIATSKKTGVGHPHRAEAEALAERDEHELGGLSLSAENKRRLRKYGQSVEEAFPMADGYVNLQSRVTAEPALVRMLDLVLGSPFISPTKDEVAMFHAQAAAVRSADLSRQVGAAVANDEGDILAVGCNEVPKAGGGAYWEGDPQDARDFQRGRDANQDQRERAMGEVFEVLAARGLLAEAAKAAGSQQFIASLSDTRIDGLIEFTRATHAEMAALLDASRRGISVQGASLYTSTFPCHNCAKHIVTAGVMRVVFIEPYPKSLAEQLHGDAIRVDDPAQVNSSVQFEHFSGIAPISYLALFRAHGKRKEFDGAPAAFRVDQLTPKLRANFRSDMLTIEEAVIAEVKDYREAGSPLSLEDVRAWEADFTP